MSTHRPSGPPTMTPQARAAAVYNAAADTYDTAGTLFWERFSRRTIERLSLNEGARVLDVCCGSGASALAAAERVGRNGSVLAVDLAEKQLEQARRKAERKGLANTEFRIGDLTELAITDEFDAVICVFGIFFVPDMVSAVARLWSLVSPGGVLALTTWGPRLFEPANSLFWQAVENEAPALKQAFSPWDRTTQPATLSALLDEAGIPNSKVQLESGTVALRGPEDWWMIVQGSGYRATVDQLAPDAQDRVRTYTLGKLEEQGVDSIEANVLYATARRAVAA